MFNFLKIMSYNIKDVIVNRISLVSKGKRPAVPKAETSFSIFKTASKTLLSKENLEKLEKISNDYNGIIKNDNESV